MTLTQPIDHRLLELAYAFEAQTARHIRPDTLHLTAEDARELAESLVGLLIYERGASSPRAFNGSPASLVGTTYRGWKIAEVTAPQTCFSRAADQGHSMSHPSAHSACSNEHLSN